MIFWKYKLLTMVKCLILNTPVFYLIIVIIKLIRVCFFIVEFKLNNGTFQIINHLTNSALQLKITFYNKDKKPITISSYSYFLFVYFFHFDFKGAVKYTAILSKFLHFLWKPFFPGQTPFPPRSGTWILDLSHDPIWAIWLAEVRKFHQHHS